jgi:GntR family transcriptional regulator, arabinose operon transcriptional repressor
MIYQPGVGEVGGVISVNRRQPLYRKLYNHVLQQIGERRLGPGDRVPSEKELSARFKVSRITSKRALEMLASEGTIVRVPGKGSFITESAHSGSSTGASGAKSNMLMGCVVADVDDAFGTRLLHGMEQQFSELGYHLVLHISHDKSTEEERAIGSLLDAGIRGLLIMPCHGEHYNPAVLKLVLDRFPLVFVDRYLRGLAASSVGTDNIVAAKRGVDYLIELGHRSIAFISSPAGNTSTIEERLEGFVKSHADHGVVSDQELRLEILKGERPLYWTMADVRAEIELVGDHLAAHPEITAVFASEYSIAKVVELAAREIGRRIPEELSLLCFDQPMRYDVAPHFTHLRQREFEIGRKASQIAHALASGSSAIEKVRLDAELKVGGTTAPPLRAS